MAKPSVTTSTPSVSRSEISQPTSSAGDAGDERRDGGADEELPGIPERPVDLDIEDAEGVHPQAPEPDDAEVGDPGEAQLEVEEQGEADDHGDLEEAGDQEGVEPVEVHRATPSPSR